MFKVFSHYVPISMVILLILEMLVLYFSVYAGIELRFYHSPNRELAIQLLGALNYKALLFAFLMILSMTAMGLHTRSVVDNHTSMLIRMLLGFALGFFVTVIVYYVYPDFFLGRGIIAITFAIAYIGILLTRAVHEKIDNHDLFKRRILVLGTGKKTIILESLIDKAMKQGYEIIGFVNVNGNEPLISNVNIYNIETTLLDLCVEHNIDEIVLAMDDRRNQFPTDGLLECKMNGIIIHDLITILERVNGHIDIAAIHPSTIIFSEGFTNAVSMNNIKRVFDVLSCLILLLIASPLIIITSCIIWLSSMGRDPILYRQVRVGLSNHPFNVLKFRSMKMDAEKDGAQFAAKNDSRVTKFGQFMRKTRIDELPQLVNVLKGDMSFIGPRPERPEFVLGFEQSIPHYSLRHSVKPGITGWAQINYPYGETDEDTKNKLQYDLYYIKNYSLFLDITIILQTIQVVLFGQGAR
ncbi:MAG: TIGR03013 family PEP-CTERM/XrtA system glycosyltransferase [Methylococcales bacterium]